MVLIRALVALHPREWRARYGEEFAALLDDVRLTPAAVSDVLANAARLRIREHRPLAEILAAAIVSVACHLIAHLAGFAPNILWLPHGPAQAVLLLGAVAPVPAVMIARRIRPTATGA